MRTELLINAYGCWTLFKLYEDTRPRLAAWLNIVGALSMLLYIVFVIVGLP